MDKSKVKTVTQIKADQPCENKRQALSQIKRIDWSSLEFRTPNQKTFYRTIGRNGVTFSISPGKYPIFSPSTSTSGFVITNLSYLP